MLERLVYAARFDESHLWRPEARRGEAKEPDTAPAEYARRVRSYSDSKGVTETSLFHISVPAAAAQRAALCAPKA